ncbi:MAG: tagatose-bisphosphate aldolase [Vagococcus fluvialis]|uniref:tagatose-bisphosphate aldolase n=1 Tax=Vagococcus fluvialis TaxID=2738 RepID=UPI000A342437|nr:tagatose-bisphosphate aldolase [Vagococcus fluvialis]MBO0421219.1 tagatose-bisphosphate aldolase [Vagococcus fluvialis]OTP31660.1 tagatose 1,6-diphosphate aldolase [Enterococcus sp. 6C8_DIV0013]
MKKLSASKLSFMNQLSTKDGVIAALAIDQRGALRKMLAAEGFEGDIEQAIVEFKKLVSEELTPYSSSILLDPEYGLPASKVKVADAGLLLAYEQTGYDATEAGRFPDLIHNYSALRIKEDGADAVKFLLYYDVDESTEINERKHAFVERIGSECMAEDIPFYLELLSYDATNADNGSKEFAKVKPHKVNDMMVEFSKDRYHVDVLKMEVPVNMNYVEGFAKSEEDVVYTREEALGYFKEQSEKTELPFIFLSAGVSAKLFQDTLYFAKEAGSDFNGVLCGRATWKDGVSVFVKEGEAATREWLRTTGKQNMDDLNKALADTATSWHKKFN